MSASTIRITPLLADGTPDPAKSPVITNGAAKWTEFHPDTPKWEPFLPDGARIVTMSVRFRLPRYGPGRRLDYVRLLATIMGNDGLLARRRALTRATRRTRLSP